MKVLVFIFMFIPSFVFAHDVRNEVLRMSNMILDNPALVQDLNEENVNIMAYSIIEKEDGVTQYKLTVDRTCFCRPKPGEVIVLQDLRPTFVDGPIKYEYKINWK